MRIYLLLATLSLLFFTGCGCEVSPEKMTPEEKRLVYHSVQDEIEERIAQGDMYSASGYYADAAATYELVNFYEDRAVIPVDTIQKLKTRAKANGKHYYGRAMSQLKKDKKKALHEFNKMMRNDPDYKDGKARFDALKHDPEIKPFLTKLESSLQKALESNKGSAKDLKKIDDALEALIKYDDYSPVALRAKELIEDQRAEILNEAVRLYSKGSLQQAKTKFTLMQSLYKKDRTAEKYLARINEKMELLRIIAQAKTSFEKGEYREAIELSEKALNMESGNKAALELNKQAKLEYEKLIPKLIEEGKDFYQKQDLENALKAFQAVLIWDPDDNTSLTYIKKIENQLETIKSLK